MQINWKVRFKNRVWLAALIALVVKFVFEALAMLEIAPAVTEEWVMTVVDTVLTLLTMMGVIVDPTTKGVSDSDRAMTYDNPN